MPPSHDTQGARGQGERHVAQVCQGAALPLEHGQGRGVPLEDQRHPPWRRDKKRRETKREREGGEHGV